jgi:hypothetical protein
VTRSDAQIRGSVPTCLGALTALESAGLVEGDEQGWLVAVGVARK